MSPLRFAQCIKNKRKCEQRCSARDKQVRGPDAAEKCQEFCRCQLKLHDCTIACGGHVTPLVEYKGLSGALVVKP